LMSEYMQEYWDEKVFCVQKWSLYWYSFIFFPTLFYVLTLWVIIRFSYHGVDNIHAKYFLVWFVTLLFFLILIPIINKYISYKMDFLIVTPRSIAKYNQIWLFQNEIRTMNSDNIKTISIKKDWLLRSVFDSGDMRCLRSMKNKNILCCASWEC